ncbi:hypothetical protein ACRYI5_05200 [Furfurilactobacillus sp. WILCCON 0119]|uniref:hypothetical protein n=1 Tax=Furfurilactobacillus entadae TaxID=2922307 RepID=UPI0035E67C3F
MKDVITYLAQHVDNDELLGQLVRDIVTFEARNQQPDVKQLTNNINQVARRFVAGSEQEQDLTHVHRDPKLAALSQLLTTQREPVQVTNGQPLLGAPRYTTEQN